MRESTLDRVGGNKLGKMGGIGPDEGGEQGDGVVSAHHCTPKMKKYIQRPPNLYIQPQFLPYSVRIIGGL